jgi:hypothetical protein
MEDLSCPQCGEILTNSFGCFQCGWTLPDPDRYVDFRRKVKRMRREIRAMALYGEHLEEPV